MNLESQVVSLEIAKKLKELGVKQESLWYWYDYSHNDKIRNFCMTSSFWVKKYQARRLKKSCSAFTCTELGKILKDNYPYWMQPSFDNGDYGFEACELYYKWLQEDTEANARGKMLIYLLENKLMEA